MPIPVCLCPSQNGTPIQRNLTLRSKWAILSLNPCFNGTPIQRIRFYAFWRNRKCLNPCFNGTPIQRRYAWTRDAAESVLILVLTEHPFRDTLLKVLKVSGKIVLILVLTEHPFREQMTNRENYPQWSLNPCFNGTPIQRSKKVIRQWVEEKS